MLSDRQKRFAFEYVKDFVATKAAERAGYSPKTAYSQGSELLKHPEIQAEIEALKEMHACVARLTPEWVLHQWMQIASANPSELVRVEVDCCRECWAMDDGNLPPNPDCRRCKGAGESRVAVADTRTLSGAARRLYAGAVETKDGVKVLMRDQDGALAKLADYLGMSNKSASAVAIAVARNDARAEDLSDDELAAIVAAGMPTLGVSEGVSPAGSLPSNTIEGTF